MDISIVDSILEGFAKLPEKYHTICLHGGEPLLMGKKWFKQFVGKIHSFNEKNTEKRVSIAIQTNAIDIDDEWIELFKLGPIGVSVSIDGPQDIHDFARIDGTGKGTYERVIASIQSLKKAKIEPSAIAVVTKYTTLLKPEDYYHFFSDIGLREIDIAPYIETGDSKIEESIRISYEPDPMKLSSFVKGLFDVWLFDSNSDGFVNIRSFEQTVAALLGYIPTLCNRQGGLACGRTPCIMPDGTVFACDLETDQIDLRLGSLVFEKFENIIRPERLSQLHNYIKQAFLKLGCYSCGLLGLCAFACPRFAFAKRNLSSYCCPFSKEFINHVRNRLDCISKEICGDTIEFTTPFKGTAANSR